MWKDPVVEEVRKQRLRIEADCNNDFNKIFEQAMKMQEKLVSRLVSKPGLKEPEEVTSENG